MVSVCLCVFSLGGRSYQLRTLPAMDSCSCEFLCGSPVLELSRRVNMLNSPCDLTFVEMNVSAHAFACRTLFGIPSFESLEKGLTPKKRCRIASGRGLGRIHASINPYRETANGGGGTPVHSDTTWLPQSQKRTHAYAFIFKRHGQMIDIR